MRAKSFAGDEDFDDEDEEDEENGKEEEDEEEEAYVPIMQIHGAEHVFPLSFVPKRRSVENELQRVVLVPAPLVAHSDLKNTCVKGLHSVCRCMSCCGAEPVVRRELLGAEVHHERYLSKTSSLLYFIINMTLLYELTIHIPHLSQGLSEHG